MTDVLYRGPASDVDALRAVAAWHGRTMADEMRNAVRFYLLAHAAEIAGGATNEQLRAVAEEMFAPPQNPYPLLVKAIESDSVAP